MVSLAIVSAASIHFFMVNHNTCFLFNRSQSSYQRTDKKDAKYIAISGNDYNDGHYYSKPGSTSSGPPAGIITGKTRDTKTNTGQLMSAARVIAIDTSDVEFYDSVES